MTIKAYDGAAWQTQKSLKIYNGSAWTAAKQAWIYNGSSWVINYPEFPANTATPSISAQSGTSGRIDCVYIINVGTWNSYDAYTPTSYTYQWTRAGSNISGATNNTYTTVAADAETIIGCRVTAINQRGSTPITVSTGITMLPQVTSINAYDYTTTPTAPGSVTVTPTNLTYTGSWTDGSNGVTTYEGTGSGTAGTPSFNYGAQTFSGTGTAGTATVRVRSVNNTKKVFVSWGVSTGAISYDLYVNGSYFTNVSPGTNNYYIYTAPDENARTFTVYPRSTSIQGYGIQYGTAVAATAKYSGYTDGSGTLSEPNATSPTSASSSGTTSSLSVSWSGSTNATKYRVYWTGASSISLDPESNYDTEVTGTSASFSSSLTAGNTYYFYISASGANNVWTPYGAYKTSTVIPVPLPDTPTGLSATAAGQTQINLVWNTSANASSYEIYYYPDSPSTPSAGSAADFAGISGNTYSNTGLSAGTTRYYWVRARNATGTSAWSNAAGATTTSAPVATKPTITATNSWSNPGVNTWTLSMTHTGGGVPTTFNWGIQFANSNGGTVLASTTGNGTWTAGSGGTQTVTRNSSTYTYARWVNVTATNASGTSSPAGTTTWE